MVHSCSVPNCPSTGKGVVMHTYPNDPEMFSIWATTIGRTDLLEIGITAVRKSRKVCDMHFSKDQRGQKRRNSDLKALAVPDLHIHLPKGFWEYSERDIMLVSQGKGEAMSRVMEVVVQQCLPATFRENDGGVQEKTVPKGFFKYTEDQLLAVSKLKEQAEGSERTPEQCTTYSSVQVLTERSVLSTTSKLGVTMRSVLGPSYSLGAAFVPRPKRIEKLDIATHLDTSSTSIDLQPPDTVQLGAEISISNDLLNDPLDTSSNIIQISAANITAPTSHTTKNYPTDGMKEESTVEEGEVQITTSFTEPSNQFLLLQDIAETCRVCLCGGAGVDLHKTQYEGLTYFEMLEEVVGAKLKERHSVLICKGCEDGMIKAYMFKRQWEKSERVLDMWQVQNVKSTNEGHLDKDNTDKTQDSVSLQENPKLITKFYMYQGKINHNIDFGKLVEINKKRAITMTQGKTKYSRVFISPTGTMTRLSANDNRNIIRRAYQLGRKGQRRKLKATKTVTYPMACKICSENLNTENDYKDHVKETKHFHTPFPCDHCNRIFPSERTLKSHKARLLQRELCDRCGASFNTTSGLQYHVKMMHSGREKHKCSTCGKSHVDFKQLIRHRRLVHPRIQQPKTEVCELCGVKLSCRASLYAHKNQVHFNIRPVRCIICDARFSCRSLLKRHEAVHNLETFECGFCNIVFKHEDKFNSHRRRRHTALSIGANVITEYTPSSCEFCDLVCPNKQALSVHLKQHNIIVCIYCDDNTFEEAEELVDHHMKLHEALSEYMCRYCDKLYDGAESLYAHLSIHKCRTFKCDKCPKMYDSSSKLKRHKMYHEGVMKFNCRFCPRKFMYSTSVAIHERIHTGERPYKCDVCGSSHICASSRHKHRQTHFVKNSLNADISGL